MSCRKVKVAEVKQNLTAGLKSAGDLVDVAGGHGANAAANAGTGNSAKNGDPEIDHVIERCLDEEIQKPQLDTYTYRYYLFVTHKYLLNRIKNVKETEKVEKYSLHTGLLYMDEASPILKGVMILYYNYYQITQSIISVSLAQW